MKKVEFEDYPITFLPSRMMRVAVTWLPFPTCPGALSMEILFRRPS